MSLRELPDLTEEDEVDNHNNSNKEQPLTRVDSDDLSRHSNTNNDSTSYKKKKRRRRRTPIQRKDKKISFEMAHVLWFAGLRGAVAYACVREFPNVYGHDDEFIAATMFIILFTVVLMGGGTEYLLEYLGIEMGVDEEQYMFEWRKEHELKGKFHDLGKYTFGSVWICHWTAIPHTLPLFHPLLPTEEAYIHQYVTREHSRLDLKPPFSFSEDEDDSEGDPSMPGTPPRVPWQQPHVSIELIRAATAPPEEKDDAFSYQPASDA